MKKGAVEVGGGLFDSETSVTLDQHNVHVGAIELTATVADVSD
jgi:hypothetical protein